MITKLSKSRKFLAKYTSGPITLARTLASTRKCENKTLAEFSKKLGITASHLSDIENERKTVSPIRATLFARKLGLSEKQFVRLALQDILRNQGLSKYQVQLNAA